MLLTPITPARADSENILGSQQTNFKKLPLHNEQNNKVSVKYVPILNEFSAVPDKNNVHGSFTKAG